MFNPSLSPSVWGDCSSCGSSIWQRGCGELPVQHSCQSRPSRQGKHVHIGKKKVTGVYLYKNKPNLYFFCFCHCRLQEQETPLHCAAWHGYSAVARALCQAGCHVDAKNREGESALLTASARGFVDIVECLVEHGANLEASDKVNKMCQDNGLVESVRFCSTCTICCR